MSTRCVGKNENLLPSSVAFMVISSPADWIASAPFTAPAPYRPLSRLVATWSSVRRRVELPPGRGNCIAGVESKSARSPGVGTTGGGVGTVVGVEAGDAVGEGVVGENVAGDEVGDAVVGAAVVGTAAAAVGALVVGDAVGGAVVGDDVGAALGAWLGEAVVGEAVGAAVGDAVVGEDVGAWVVTSGAPEQVVGRSGRVRLE
mmetsp:Transcript_28697/g.48174  ORF Transcript_28697/g.48174 Transcript_28697/m.48174 type:complete len:202 (-) Transcript_28697:841-1446(-)